MVSHLPLSKTLPGLRDCPQASHMGPSCPPGSWEPVGFYSTPPLFFGLGFLSRNDRYARSTARVGLKQHFPLDKGEKRMVLAHADIGAGMPLGAALAHDDVPPEDGLAAEFLPAEPPAFRVAPVAGGPACLFMRHLSGSDLIRLFWPRRPGRP